MSSASPPRDGAVLQMLFRSSRSALSTVCGLLVVPCGVSSVVRALFCCRSLRPFRRCRGCVEGPADV
eukprot:12909079-Prorocentrum_lima.AAC.1